MNTVIFNSNSDINYIDNAANILKNNGVGIFPTDTVYGIGCSAFSNEAIQKLFLFKERNYAKPINVLISKKEMLSSLVETISLEEQTLINEFWPGALTIIFHKKKGISDLLTSNLSTIGIRMPNDPIALELLNQVDLPLATTSANLSGKFAGVSVSDFYNEFNNKVDFIIDDGKSAIGTASTIVQVIDGIPHILREGSITKEQIEKVLKLK